MKKFDNRNNSLLWLSRRIPQNYCRNTSALTNIQLLERVPTEWTLIYWAGPYHKLWKPEGSPPIPKWATPNISAIAYSASYCSYFMLLSPQATKIFQNKAQPIAAAGPYGSYHSVPENSTNSDSSHPVCLYPSIISAWATLWLPALLPWSITVLSGSAGSNVAQILSSLSFQTVQPDPELSPAPPDCNSNPHPEPGWHSHAPLHFHGTRQLAWQLAPHGLTVVVSAELALRGGSCGSL